MHMIFDISSDPSNNSLMIDWATVTYLQPFKFRNKKWGFGGSTLLAYWKKCWANDFIFHIKGSIF